MGMSEPTDESDSEEEREVPKHWVEQYFQYENEITEILDDVKRAKMRNNHQKARELLIDLGESNYDVYKVVLYSTIIQEEFLDDVEEQMGTEVRDRLTTTHKEYSELVKELRLIRHLVDSPRENLPTTGSLSVEYSYSQEYPIIDYTLYSGDVELLDIKSGPGILLHTGELLIDAATTALESANEHETPISEEELNSIVSFYQSLQSRMEDTDEMIEELIEEQETPEDEMGTDEQSQEP